MLQVFVDRGDMLRCLGHVRNLRWSGISGFDVIQQVHSTSNEHKSKHLDSLWGALTGPLLAEATLAKWSPAPGRNDIKTTHDMLDGASTGP